MSRNKIIISVLSILIVAAVSAFIIAGENGEKAVHQIAHQAGICADQHCVTETATSAHDAACATGSADCPAPAHAVAHIELSADEQKVVNYIADEIEKNNRIKFEEEEIEKATGVSADILSEARLQSAVIAEFQFGCSRQRR